MIEQTSNYTLPYDFKICDGSVEGHLHYTDSPLLLFIYLRQLARSFTTFWNVYSLSGIKAGIFLNS